MALVARRTEFSPPPGTLIQQAIPAASVILFSLVTLLPYIATAPILPPFGYLMLLAWRLPRSDIWPVWAPLPLGFFDDMFSGSPIGTAMALWTITFVCIDLIDRRIVWRDHWQDWSIAGGAIVCYLVAALAIDTLTGGGTPIVLLLPQAIFSILAFPLVSRIAAMLDRWRLGR